MRQLDSTTKKEKWKHLSFEDRKKIQKKLRKGFSITRIAGELERDKNTIRREIERGTVVEHKVHPYISKDPNFPIYIIRKVYYAEEGQKVYEERRKKCVWRGKLEKCKELIKFVEGKVKAKGENKLSPDAAIGHARINNLFPGQSISTKTFYNFMDKNKLGANNSDLLRKDRMKPRKKCNNPKEHKKKMGKSIDERSFSPEDRSDFGHWEGDFIVGKDKESYLFTLVERKHRIGFAFKVPNRERTHVVEIIDMLEELYGEYFKDIFKSITFDNGSEFSDSIGMEKNNRIQVYYAHPYSSYERGSNENWNGIIRRVLPKGICFKNLTEERINEIVNAINSMPRKILGYNSSLELWEEEINAIIAQGTDQQRTG
jgi:IS30 family transposase